MKCRVASCPVFQGGTATCSGARTRCGNVVLDCQTVLLYYMPNAGLTDFFAVA